MSELQRLHPDATWITFEGIEGTGKSTQLERLRQRLEQRGKSVVTTREPGGTAIGEGLRALLLAPAEPPMHPTTELLLYAADRAQHLVEVIFPALEDGRIVLCDRYLDATLAYQGFARGLGFERVLELHRDSPLDQRPDRTLLLDLDPLAALSRAQQRNRELGTEETEGRFEREQLDFHQRVRQGYLELARREPQRIRVVDATGTADAVARRVSRELGDLPGLGEDQP
jgi:dTMP kinase